LNGLPADGRTRDRPSPQARPNPLLSARIGLLFYQGSNPFFYNFSNSKRKLSALIFAAFACIMQKDYMKGAYTGDHYYRLKT
jgi:hypothetical protein